MAEQDYENAELYGGAITADLPADFLDIRYTSFRTPGSEDPV